MSKEEIDKLREVCGTLPNRTIEENTEIIYGCEALNIELVDSPRNPYKAIFTIATATWGDDKYDLKWPKVGPLERYMVVMNALRGNTLPTALEAPSYTFQITGVPRHCFDQFARTRIGAGFGSSGCRDNSKMDSSIILYSEYLNMPEDFKEILKDHFKTMKRIYSLVINEGKESYQMARSVMPMSYHHPFSFTQNLLSLIGQCRRRMCFGEEEFIVGIHWKIRDIFEHSLGMKLVANAMRPACDFAGKCLYSKGDGSELFSNLFRGCGRYPSKSYYSEFNKTCTNRENLEKDLSIDIPSSNLDYLNFTPDEEGFSLLGEGDRRFFYED